MSPVVDGLFERDDTGGATLIGSRCAGCGAVYFPQAAGCRNPDCRDKRIGRTLLPGEGTLWSYTVQHYRPPPLFGWDDWSPYALGVVDLGEGVRAMGMLAGVPLDEIRIGMRLRVVETLLRNEPQRGAISTYAFAPAAGGEVAR